MSEIEVGDYARTKDGYIAKLIEPMLYQLGNGENIDFLEDIVNHSKQLIDLIEVGDIVNGYRVENVINEGLCPSGKYIDIDSSKDSSECTLWEEDIQTILTKESYMANCYKVGGE